MVEQRKYFHGLNENNKKRGAQKNKNPKQKIKIEWLFVALEHFICLFIRLRCKLQCGNILMRVLHSEFCICRSKCS